MDQKFVFEGRVGHVDYYRGDINDVLLLDNPADPDDGNPLVERFAEALGKERKQVSIRYFISMEPLTEEQRTDVEVQIAVGEGYAEFVSRYSDLTGYLWTDQEMTVGGHDLENEIGSHEGKWCRLELTVHNATSARY